MSDDFIDPDNLSKFNLPENIISQLFEFSGSNGGDSGFILSYVNQEGLPAIITKANSPIIEMGLRKALEEYFPTATLQSKIKKPLELTDNLTTYNIKVNVYGGGVNGQAESIRLAISRALCEVDEEYRPVLKKEGLLTRDPRMVERKKFGQKKARKKFQFSKR